MVHGPIIVFSRYFLLRDLQGLEIAAVVVASLVLAYLSWRFVETLFRHPRKPLPRPAMFAVAASALAGCIALGVAGAATDGYRSRFPALQASRHPIAAVDSWLNGKCFLENQDASVWAGDVCTRTAGASRTALLWGDSFAAHYIPGLMANQTHLDHNIVQYTFGGCPPILSYQSYARPGCTGFNARVFEVIKSRHIDAVVLSARWDELRQRGLSGVLDYRAAGRTTAGDGASWYLSFDRGFNDRLRAVAGGSTFIDPLGAFCDELACT